MANSEELQLEQQPYVFSNAITIPTTPVNTPMSEDSPTQLPIHVTRNISEDTTSDTVTADVSRDEETPFPTIGDDETDIYTALTPNTILVIPITNPSAFPIQRIQEVQSQRYPSAIITNMLCHKTFSGPITQVTADIEDGSINHLFIRDPRFISALGLVAPNFDTIYLDTNKLKVDETFTIRILPGQRPQKLDEWIMGVLVSARHAYLYWLDERRTADPKHAPYATEAKAIARKTGRRWPDVMREIEVVWRPEQESNGKHYREDRTRYLGEDPTFPEGAEDGRMVRSMFG